MRCISSFFITVIALSHIAFGAPGEFTPVKISGKEGMIVPESVLRRSALSAEGYWTPTKTELVEAERRLPQFLQKELRSLPALADLSIVVAQAPRYRRQYIGMISGGRKIIWINCFPAKPPEGPDPFENWNREIIDVSDGGSKYWGAIFDVKKQSFERLILNGPG
ncbi:MAG TPA: hypothetical protein VGK77_19440 [Candidatus Binatia bacterium]|jgi:hypothetical protein